MASPSPSEPVINFHDFSFIHQAQQAQDNYDNALHCPQSLSLPKDCLSDEKARPSPVDRKDSMPSSSPNILSKGEVDPRNEIDFFEGEEWAPATVFNDMINDILERGLNVDILRNFKFPTGMEFLAKLGRDLLTCASDKAVQETQPIPKINKGKKNRRPLSTRKRYMKSSKLQDMNVAAKLARDRNRQRNRRRYDKDAPFSAQRAGFFIERLKQQLTEVQVVDVPGDVLDLPRQKTSWAGPCNMTKDKCIDVKSLHATETGPKTVLHDEVNSEVKRLVEKEGYRYVPNTPG